jgi:hypothetical protein
LESETSPDLFTSPVVGEPEIEPIQMSEHSHPKVGQEDSYDGYIKPKEPFSRTDGYQYAL